MSSAIARFPFARILAAISACVLLGGSTLVSPGCGSESSDGGGSTTTTSDHSSREASGGSPSSGSESGTDPLSENLAENARDAADEAAEAAGDVATEMGEAMSDVEELVAGGSSDGVTIDPALPEYEPRQRVSGNLNFAGSDTMTNLVALWAQSFNSVHPAVKPQAEGKGSSTAPPALIEGQAHFGAMSREMKPEETQKFVEEYGFEPTQLRVAIDAIGLFVNKDNPIESLTLDQVQQAFSVTGGDLTWGDLGVMDAGWANLPVSLYGRNEASGTYGFFQKAGLGGADYKPTVKTQPGSAGVVSAVSNDRGGLGYSGLGYRTADVKVIPVAIDEYQAPVVPDVESVSSGEYPLARFLYLYLRHDRRETLDLLRVEFLRMVFSRQGQESVVQDGVYPISARLAREELEALGIEPGF